MKENIIQLLNVAGTPTACYQIDSVDSLSKLYDGQLLRIGSKGLVDFTRNHDLENDNPEKFRFVVAKNPEEKHMLLKVEPIRCYVRDHQMNSKVIEVNPYQSVRWLKNQIEKQRNCSVKLVINETQLSQDSNSLIKYIHENAIIHVIQLRNQKIIPILYTKQPGSQSKIHRLQNVDTSHKIQWLVHQVSKLTGIPFDCLFLVYAGKVLPKDRQIGEYHLQQNGCLYAVDSRKYMKKVSKSQYQNRLAEVRKVKQNNKAVVQKVKQQNQKKQKLNPITMQKGERSKKGTIERSGTLVDKLQEDIQYFKNPSMQIQSEQAKQFERRGNQLQKCVQNTRPQQVTSGRFPGDLGVGTPPNSPIFAYNRQQSYNSVNSQLKQGRIITKDTQVYQDPQGYIHQHNKQKAVFKNGKTKIVQTDVTQDQQGNIIKVQHDYIKVKRDPQTGNITKIQTDIIQDAQNGKTIIKRKQVKDEHGNIIATQTDVIKDQKQSGSHKKIERDIIRQGGKVTTVNTQVLQDKRGNPTKIQTDIVQKKQDQQGNTHQYSKDIKQQDGVTTVIQRNVVRNKQGSVIQLKTDVIKITQDEQGNIYKHERNEIDKQNKKIIIQRDIVTDKNGQVISKQTDMKVVQQDSNQNVHKHETDIIQGVDGKTIVIQKNIIQDSEGNIIKSQTDMFELNKDEKYQPRQVQISHDKPSALITQNQQQPLISAGKQVTIDQLGNTHTHQKQLVQKQGKTTFVDRDTIQDPRGKVIRIQTDIVEIEGDNQGNMHKHKSQIIQSEGKVVMVQTDQIMDPDGVTLRKQKDTIQIDQAQDGSLIKHEKDVIEQNGITKIIVRQIIQDADGNVIRSETKVTQIQQDEDTVNVHEKEQVLQAVQDDGTMVEGQQEMKRQVQVIQDQEGNTLTRQKQIVQDEEGKTTVVYRNIIENPQGQILKQQTQMLHVHDDGTNAPQIHRHAINYSQIDNSVKIEEVTSKQGLDGSVIRSEKETIEIEQQQDGTVKRKEMDVVQQNDKKVVHVRNVLEDQRGRLISKTSDVIELQAEDRSKLALRQGQQLQQIQKSNVSRKYDVDNQGNLHILQTQIKNDRTKQTIVQRQFITNPQGKLLKTQTGILQVKQSKDGSLTQFTSTQIVQQGNVVTIIQNDSIQNQQGQQLRNQSGSLQIQDIGAGVVRKTKQNIIEEGGVRIKLQKQVYQDQQGNVLQENSKTTQLTDQYDKTGALVSQGFKTKQKQIVQDQHGNIHYKQRELIDNNQGKSTIVQTQVIRSLQGNLIKATTDVIQTKLQQDGNISRCQTNIIQKPGKMTIAQSKTIQNQQGQRLQGEVQSIVVSRGQNGQIIKKQTGIIMQDMQKTIVQKIIVQDAQGKIIRAQTKKKRIYTDQNGVQQARDVQTYQVNQQQEAGENSASTFEKQVTVDAYGNIKTIQRQTIQQGDNSQKVIQTTSVKKADGTLAQLQTDVLQIKKTQSGTQLIKQTNIIQDENKLTVVENSAISNRQGEVLTSKTQILQLEEGQNGQTKRTQTNILEECGQTTIIQKKGIQTGQGILIDQSMNVTKIIKHNDGSVQVIQNSQPLEHTKHSLMVQQQPGVTYTQVDSIIKDPMQIQLAPSKQRQLIQDIQGNLHTLQKQVIVNQDGTTVIKSQTVQNPSGKVIVINTNITDTKELDDGKILRHQTQIVSGQKLVTTEIYTIENADGSVHSEKTRKVQIQQQDGLIKTSKIDVVRKDGKTKVTGVQTLQDQDGNIIDKSSNQLNISQSEQAVRQQARRIARAQVRGQVTGVVTQYRQDEQGNKHIIQRQTIQDNGKSIVVDHETVRNPQGQVLVIQTNIITEQAKGDGKIQRHQTEITQLGGKTRVVQFTQIKQDSQLLESGNSGAGSRISSSIHSSKVNTNNNNLSDLLGFNDEQPQQQGTIRQQQLMQQYDNINLLEQSSKSKNMESSSQSKKAGINSNKQVNLLDLSLGNNASQKKISQLPLQSRKQLNLGDLNTKQQQRQQLPQQYQITVLNKQRQQITLKVGYDYIIDEVAQKLAQVLGKPKQSIKFYKDGNELQDYQLLTDLDIMPGTELYYFVDQDLATGK